MQNHLESMLAKQREEEKKESDKFNKQLEALLSLETSHQNA
jgi:hypothetical protein